MLFENLQRKLSISSELKDPQEAKENLAKSENIKSKSFSISGMLNPVLPPLKTITEAGRLPGFEPRKTLGLSNSADAQLSRPELGYSHQRLHSEPIRIHHSPSRSLDSSSRSFSHPRSPLNSNSSPYSSPNPRSSPYPRADSSRDGKLDRLQNGTLVERKCGDCGANSTSGHWSQDTMVVGGYICQKCYRRRKRAERDNKPYSVRNKNCQDCKVKDSVVWFRHFSIPGKYICSPCHNVKTGIETNSCHACGTHKSTKWSSDSKGNTVCRSCHRQLRSVALVLTGFGQ